MQLALSPQALYGQDKHIPQKFLICEVYLLEIYSHYTVETVHGSSPLTLLNLPLV